jgi:hypothetical protein
MQGTVLVDKPFPDEPPLEQIYNDLLIGDVDAGRALRLDHEKDPARHLRARTLLSIASPTSLTARKTRCASRRTRATNPD